MAGDTSGRDRQFPALPTMTPEQFLVALARAGCTNEEIAKCFGMTLAQFNLLLRDDKELKDILDEAKEEPNHMVERALFKRAMGYETREVTKEDGKPVKVVIKDIPPDPTSCIFWLKNRDPKRWRDAIEMKFSLRDRMDRAHSVMGTSKRKQLRSDFSE